MEVTEMMRPAFPCPDDKQEGMLKGELVLLIMFAVYSSQPQYVAFQDAIEDAATATQLYFEFIFKNDGVQKFERGKDWR